jgi:hypothetical protein
MAERNRSKGNGNGNDGEASRARRPVNPFRGVLDRMVDDRAVKVELGLLKEDDVVKELVRIKDTGDIFGIELKRLRKGTKTS